MSRSTLMRKLEQSDSCAESVRGEPASCANNSKLMARFMCGEIYIYGNRRGHGLPEPQRLALFQHGEQVTVSAKLLAFVQRESVNLFSG